MQQTLDRGLFVLTSGSEGKLRRVVGAGADAPAATPVAATPAAAPVVASGALAVVDSVYRIGSYVAMPALFWHGLQRNDSIGWGLAWGILGDIVWPFALPYAFRQGFAKPDLERAENKAKEAQRSLQRQRLLAAAA